MLSGVVRPVFGDAVDRDQRAVQDGVRQSARSSHRCGQVIGGGGEQVVSFSDVTPRGGDSDAEPAGQAGIGVAVSQVGRTSRPVRRGSGGATVTGAGPVSADEVGQMLGGCGWTTGSSRGRTAFARGSCAGELFLVDCCPIGSRSRPDNRPRTATDYTPDQPRQLERAELDPK